MSGALYEGIKRKGLSFKGEDDRSKKKRRHKKEIEKPGEPKQEGLGLPDMDDDEDDIPMVPGSGRIVSTTLTLHGMESKFKEELEVGDTIMVHHPVSLQVEMRVVVSVLSQRSCVVDQAFSKDLVSTTDYHIRKDSYKLKEKAKEKIGDTEAAEDPKAVQDAASEELQRQLEKRMKKQRKVVTVREKTGMWGYKMVSKKLDKAASQEEMLDERCKQGRDKYCF